MNVRIARALILCFSLLFPAGCATVSLEEPAVLPAQKVKQFFVIETRINARGPYDMILDTGSSLMGLSPAVAAQLGLLRYDRTTLRHVRMGDYTAHGIESDKQDMTALSMAVGAPLDGIISFRAFEDCILVLDYQAGTATAHPSLPAEFAESVGIPIGQFDRPFIDVDFQGRTIELLVDSGAGGDFALTSVAGLEWESSPREVGIVATAYGERPRILGRLGGSVSIGGLDIDGPMVEKATDTSFVGSGVLKEGRIAFDQKRQLMWFLPAGKTAYRAPSYRGTGMFTRRQGRGVIVYRLMEGPAKRAGVERGDEVLAVNNVSIEAIIEGAKAPPADARFIEIELRRGDEIFLKKIPVDVLVK